MKSSYWTAISLALAMTAACASSRSARQPEFVDDTAEAEFQRGVRALQKEDFSVAADIFDRLLVAKPASEFDLSTVYNSGAAHEGMGRCEKAAERYREAVRASAGKFARLEAQALFRLSLMYECMGADAKTIAALLDARKRAKNLPPEIDRAELPARLAAAYSRVGNRTKAMEYFNQASEGIKGLMAAGTSARAQRELLAKTLYFMGQLNPSQRTGEMEAVAFLQSVSIQQPYLLQALELNATPWSRRAANDLETAYDRVLLFQIRDPEARNRFLTRALQLVAELRRIRLPDAGTLEDGVFSRVDQVERQIHNEMAAVAESTRLTPEAVSRQALRREGRPVDPERPNKKRTRK